MATKVGDVKTLTLAKDLQLPLDAVTQTFLVVGKRGSGKSNTAARFVEQLHRARLPFVVLDPVDTWWGLKAGLDGAPGLDVYVFGGRKADLPLEPGAGGLLAEVLCEHRVSMVLSVKHLSGRQRSAFMVAFAQTLFQKWAGGPLHVVLEEAHELAPQMAGGRGASAEDGEAAMLGAFKRLWKLGRASGIGGTAITQRPASLSKDITTQSEILIAHRTIGPQDVKAVGEWVKYHGQHEAILGELPSLPTGQAFLWAPEFPEGQPLGLRRVQVQRRETFDSASTPKVGEQRVEPKELAPVDLDRLRSKMTATLERAKLDDPRELRKALAEKDKRIKELERGTSVSSPSNEAAKREVKVVEKPVITDAQLARAEALVGRLEKAIERSGDLVTKPLADVRGTLQELVGAVKSVRQPALPLPVVPARASYAPERTTSAKLPSKVSVAKEGSGKVGKADQRILDSLAWWRSAGIEQPTRHQVAFVAIYTVNGHFNNTLGALNTAGLISYPGPGLVALTDAGAGLADVPLEAATRAALITKVREVLRAEPQRRLFDIVAAAGRSLTREELAAAANYTVNGHFNNTLGSLSSLGVVSYPSRGAVGLSAMFDALEA